MQPIYVSCLQQCKQNNLSWLAPPMEFSLIDQLQVLPAVTFVLNKWLYHKLIGKKFWSFKYENSVFMCCREVMEISCKAMEKKNVVVKMSGNPV